MAASEPPAYSVAPTSGCTTVPTPVANKRSILDMRAIILGNAQVIKPRHRDDEIQLIVAKTVAPQESAEEIALTQHYAFLVMRKHKEQEIQIILKGEAKDSIEEALEWMVDRTETVVADALLRHGTHLNPQCCMECSKTIRPGGRSFSLGTTVPARSGG